MDSSRPGPSALWTRRQHPIVSATISSTSAGSSVVTRSISVLRGVVPSWCVWNNSQAASGERAELQRVPVALERDGSVAVGSKDLGADGTIAIQNCRHGMAEAVAAPDAHDGGTRGE